MNKKVIYMLIIIVSLFFINTNYVKAEDLKYSSHIQSIGWQNYVSDGSVSGTTGQGKRLEAYIINKTNKLLAGNILYRSYVEGIGWQDYVSDGSVSGTTGQKKIIEAIQIKLTDELSENYDIYYRVHVAKMGWLDWASNDQQTGTFGYNYQIEAIQIKLVEKGSIAPGSTSNIYCEKSLEVTYSSHIQSIGWQNYVSDGSVSGTTGQGKRLEAYRINKTNKLLAGNILYRSYVEGIGWQDYVSDGSLSGTTGQKKIIEAIQIKLTDELSENYDIYYRVHVAKMGWLDWASNDQQTGTFGYNYQIEAIQIKLVEKGSIAPGKTDNIYKKNNVTINYQSVINQQLQSQVKDGEISGTIGNATKIDQYKINFDNSNFNNLITYRSYVEGIGWQDYVSGNILSGNNSLDKKLEMIQIKLRGSLSEIYDIYYRVHVAKIGWLDWASNDQQTGTLGYNYQIEAIQIKLVEKGEIAPGETDKIFLENQNYLTYRSHVQSIGWQDYVTDGTMSGTVGMSKRIEALRIELTGEFATLYDIYYRSYVQDFGWLGWAKNGEISGSISISKRLEAYQIVLVEKGSEAPGSTDETYMDSLFRVIDGKTYYYANGMPITGFYTIQGVQYYFNQNGVLLYKNVSKVIDVSSHQGLISWEQVKSDGVNSSIIRVGYGTSYVTDACVKDSYFDYNYKNSNNLGLLRGIYLYSYAIDKVSASLEAQFVLSQLQSYGTSKNIVVYYDLESNSWTKNLTSADYDVIVSTFSNILENAGYTVNVYTYKNLAETKFSQYVKDKLTWIAQYETDENTYNGLYDGWQYTSKGIVSGISGNVDISIWKN